MLSIFLLWFIGFLWCPVLYAVTYDPKDKNFCITSGFIIGLFSWVGVLWLIIELLKKHTKVNT